MNRTALRLAAVALIAVPALGGTASPASAASTDRTSTTAFSASAFWIQYGQVPGDRAAGNVHLGQLQASEYQPGRASLSAFLTDLECPAGVRPVLGGDTSACTRVGVRSFYGQDVSVRATGGARRATLTGQVQGVYERNPITEEETVDLGMSQVDVTVIGSGAPTHSRSTSTYQEGGQTVVEHVRTTTRSAELRGQLGPVLLKDLDDVDAKLSSTRTTTRRS